MSKVTCTHVAYKDYWFKDIEPNSFFVYNEKVYIKLDATAEFSRASVTDIEFNAYSVSNGIVAYFYPDDICKPITSVDISYSF